MTPFQAYILGLLTILTIFIIFWVLSMQFQSVSAPYKILFCDQAV